MNSILSSIAVLASGSGTLLDAILSAGLPVSVVVLDRDCEAENVAKKHGVSTIVVQRASFGNDFDRDAYSESVANALAPRDVDLVVMAGYGTILGQPFHDAFPTRILNTHPALLPSFPGWHGVRDALEYGVKVTGCTVHVATLEVDSGPILAQRAVVVEPHDTEATLHERIKVVERELYVETIGAVLANPELLVGPRGSRAEP